ncbi:hypothetical protein WJX73_004764 [Symbiochloris irregularis]|uniref:Uncharacterized protein n=1 Tax=Symbiochloris irregularis TaxID=706552 RepID=A0AAW1NQ38_9CHLO
MSWRGGGAGGRGASVRSRPAGWARRAATASAGSGNLDAPASNGARGRRVVIFVIGGITRSELRVAHLMSAKLGRDVVLGSNVVDTPKSYLSRLAALSGNPDHLALEMSNAHM